ncbi:31 kDa ribonucleoprotein, chloroplastic (Fragment) [Madurella fahalii]|uniref:31 kDa ribonucleoprotein, chloroplastic n=1 Tax=Madurella fahalii TaxID=1157608 RepID=A0ABQ0G1C6_9PEZI
MRLSSQISFAQHFHLLRAPGPETSDHRYRTVPIVHRVTMHSLRRAALRSAISASRALSTKAPVTPLAAGAFKRVNVAKLRPIQAVRFFSQTERPAESDLEKTASADAAQDVEESLAQTEADILEAVQDITTPTPEPQQSEEQSKHSPPKHGAFVRNLVFEVNEEHLEQAFSKYGTIVSTYIARDPRGLSKGFGFVEFSTAEALKQACDNVNGSFWHGRRITCIPREDKRTRRTAGMKSPAAPSAQLFIGNIPYETTDAELNRLFRDIKNLKDVRVAVDRTTGWPRGFAHADFVDVESATEAFRRLQGATLADRTLRIDYAEGYQRRTPGQRRKDGESREEGRPREE